MTALILKHLPEESAGLLREILDERGIEVHVEWVHRGESLPPLEEFSLLLVMGGYQQVWQIERFPWIQAELAAIRHWVDELEKPYFGVCLGHQLLAAALGGEVGRADRYETGFPQVDLHTSGRNHPVFKVLPDRTHWMQWHEAEVRRAPPGLDVLASSDACAIQALGRGKEVLSMQFHVEGNEQIVDLWTRTPYITSELQSLDGQDADVRMRAAARAHLVDAKRNATALFERWLDLNGIT